jgi:hypothetical protein
METACFLEMLASTNRSTWRLNPKEHHNCHGRGNLKSHILWYRPDSNSRPATPIINTSRKSLWCGNEVSSEGLCCVNWIRNTQNTFQINQNAGAWRVQWSPFGCNCQPQSTKEGGALLPLLLTLPFDLPSGRSKWTLMALTRQMFVY